jgi:acyl-CoA reductase-like NAD-dependent aldehyde dehydrogenase
LDTDKLFIGGEWVSSGGGETLPVVNPATEEEEGTIPSGTPGDIDRAVAAAVSAFRSWSARPLEERLAVLERAHEKFVAASDEIAAATTREMGAPIGLATHTLTAGAAEFLAATIALARSYPYEYREGSSLVIREAYGVVGAVTPWNNPIYMMLMKAAPAIAAGCTVVHKPAEGSSLSCYIVARLLQEAGLEPGVYNLVTGRGSTVGDALDRHPDLDLVSFTGSTPAGRKVAELAAATPKRVVLELGGKSACLVLDDADIDDAVEQCMKSAFNNAGQMCGAWTRLVVPRRWLARATETAVAVASSFVVGDPRDPRTTLGPLANERQYRTVSDYIRLGIDEGAHLACGGPGKPAGLQRGYYVQPTIFSDVQNDMRIAQEEIFGPVLCIIGHDGDDHAVAIANDSDYGLRGAVFSGDPTRAERAARRIRAGQVDINGYKMSVSTPFGGYKLSGYGRCQGQHGYEEFLQVKSIQL